MTSPRTSALMLLSALLATTVTSARAEPDTGAYLASRAALIAGDFTTATGYLESAVQSDPTNAWLIDRTIAAHIGRGDLPAAIPLAAMMAEMGGRSQLTGMVMATEAATTGDWARLLANLDAGEAVSPLTDALTRGWALAGSGDMTDAIAAFDRVIETRGMRSFGLYHKAVALAMAGDFEGAGAIFALPPDQGMQRSRRAVMAHAQVLGQLGQPDQAIALIDRHFPGTADPALADLRDRMETAVSGGDIPPWTFVRHAREGLAEAYFSVSGAIVNETDDANVLFHLRVALALNPGHVEATILAAQLLERMEQYDLARAAYQMVPQDAPAFPLAELGRAEVLRRAGDTGAAIEVLAALTRAHPDLPDALVRLGDFLRQEDRLTEALTAYDAALEVVPETAPGRWRVLFTRAITHFALDHWEEAEAGFIAALDLSPDQPSVLNYYGYSLVERGENLDAALEMIERAVAGDPQNGAIVDSLGWALYRLGRHEEAVGHLERAVALEPGDPIVNDHLGDAFWTVGRQREARFQWNRALSFDPEPQEAERIRLKLEIGLTRVEEQDEAALPQTVAGSGG